MKKKFKLKFKYIIYLWLLALFLLCLSCKPAEYRIKDYSYTDKWYYEKSQRYQVYQTKSGNTYILVLNKKQTKLIRKYINNKNK